MAEAQEVTVQHRSPGYLSRWFGLMQTWLTAVMRQEDREWKLVHLHLRVGVPEEEVVELRRRWSSEGFSEAG